jgi:hypothetical protein
MTSVPPAAALGPDQPPEAVQVPTSDVTQVSVTFAGASVLEAVAVNVTAGAAKALVAIASRTKPVRNARMLYVTDNLE